MQDVSIAHISLFNPKEHHKSTDQQLNKAKRRQRVMDVTIDSDMDMEGVVGMEDGTSESDTDSTAETMQCFSKLSVDSIHVATIKVSD